jgi:hypothetical protein
MFIIFIPSSIIQFQYHQFYRQAKQNQSVKDADKKGIVKLNFLRVFSDCDVQFPQIEIPMLNNSPDDEKDNDADAVIHQNP